LVPDIARCGVRQISWRDREELGMRDATSGVAIGTFGLNGDISVAPEHSLDTLLTVEDVAAILKVNKSWVYEHTRSRGTPRSERLPYIKLGKYLRFEARAIRAYLEKKCRVT
jgi:predicted DNA-binding transcriptional regulator AlpA